MGFFGVAYLGLAWIIPACALRTAIIGAGVGGAFTAARLRELEVPTQVDVFEAQQHEGGRVQELWYRGEALELGASIFWEYNTYVKSAAERLGLALKAAGGGGGRGGRSGKREGGRPSEQGRSGGGEAVRDEDGGGLAVWDGLRFVLNMTGSWSDVLHAAIRYGPAALRYSNLVAAAARRFRRVYELQAGGAAFDSPQLLLQELGLYNETQQQCADYMQEWLVRPPWLWGGAAFAEEVAGAINRCNYNQGNTQLNALAGLVSYGPAAYGSVWSIEGGNRQLVSGLLAESCAAVIKSARVTGIRRTAGGRQFTLDVCAGPAAGGDGGAGGEAARSGEEPGVAAAAGTLQKPDAAEAVGPGTARVLMPEVEREDAAATGHGPLRCSEYGPYDAVVIAAPLLGSGIAIDLDDGAAASNAAGSGQNGAPAGGGGGDGALCGHAGVPIGPASCTAASSSTSSTSSSTSSLVPSSSDNLSAAAAASTELQRPYQVTVTSYVAGGRLRAAYFGVQRLPAASVVLVSSGGTGPFSALSARRVGGGDPDGGELVYKVFSREPLSPDLLGRMFEPGPQPPRLLVSREWYAYPRFSPPERFSPFLLAEGLVYGNALEPAASAMEMAAVAAANSALLVARHLVALGQQQQQAATAEA